MDKVLTCFTCSGFDKPKPTATGLVVALIKKNTTKSISTKIHQVLWYTIVSFLVQQLSALATRKNWEDKGRAEAKKSW